MWDCLAAGPVPLAAGPMPLAAELRPEWPLRRWWRLEDAEPFQLFQQAEVLHLRVGPEEEAGLGLRWRLLRAHDLRHPGLSLGPRLRQPASVWQRP